MQIEVQRKDASAASGDAVVIPLTIERDGKTGTMVGLVGEVDVGWKLFPLHCIKVIKPAS